MTNPVMVVRRAVDSAGNPLGRSCHTWCPGCESLHPFTIANEDGSLPSGPVWEWDGDMERPTFSPSLLVYSTVHLCEGEHPPVACLAYDAGVCDEPSHTIGAYVDGQVRWRFPHGIPVDATRVYGHVQPHTREPAFGNCHSFLRQGRWEFLGDSAHTLAGQTVDMVPLPDWWVA